VFSAVVTRRPEVDGVRPELAAAIVEMLAICPRAEVGILDVRKSLAARLNATPGEVHDALIAMQDAGVIERVHDTNPIPMWCLP
jgi:hypothetical protein